MNNQELQHHGVVGMKWGQRRYQNKDGTLTPRGKKRYEKELAKLSKEERILKNKLRTKAKFDKLNTKRRELDEMNNTISPKREKIKTPKPVITNTKRKDVKDMSDSELSEVVKRLENESKYNKLNPKKESLGKRFVKKAFKDVIVPAVAAYGKKEVERMLTDWSNERRKTKK